MMRDMPRSVDDIREPRREYRRRRGTVPRTSDCSPGLICQTLGVTADLCHVHVELQQLQCGRK
jgi:hypothetical protein